MTPQQAYEKCNYEINKDLEPYFIKDPHFAYFYARDIIKGRWKEAEPIIMKDPYYAYVYARDVIQGRWIEAEPYIIQDPVWAYYYAANVIQGKLPELMHNAMLIHADKYAKRYFNFIKSKPQP